MATKDLSSGIYHCKKCMQEDSDRMVQCNRCCSWYHFDCAGVIDEKSENSWNCDCVNVSTEVITTILSNALQNLGNTTRAGEPQATSSPAKPTGPLQEPDRDFGLCPPKIFQDTARTAVPIFTSAKQKAMVTHSAVRDTWHYDHEAPQLPFLTSNNTRATTREQPQPMAPWNFTNTQNRAASYYPENKVRMDVDLNTAMPSAAQLAARQAIPKELPTFDGNPQNWPLFYSSFQTSTEIAGYTNAENLMRLQASLKGKARYMQNPMLVQELLEKLPTQLKLQWAMFPKDTKIPSMESFSKWIYDIAEAASQVTSPLYHKKSGSLNHHTEAPEEQVKEITCVVCNEPGHKIHSCPSFKATPHQQKISFLKNHKLCQQCLNRHHQKCQREKVCGIRGCRSKHHPLIHEMQPIPEAAKSSSPNRPAMVTNVHTPEGKHTQRSRESGSTYFRVIPIQIINKTKVTNTFAFLDQGSALTLIDNKVFKQLGLKGVPDPLCLKWTNDTTREENASERVTLTVANPHNGNQFYLEEVHSVDTLDLPVQSIDIRALAKEFPHLAGLPIASYTNARPSILIGTNNWNLAVPLKIKEGAWHQPIASKTRLGWALQSSTRSRATRANVSVHMCGCRDADAKLHEIIKQAFSLDATTAKPLSSPEETQALTRLESTTSLKNGRYEVGLMWKDPEVSLPDSYANALKRLKCLQKQFSRQPQLKEQITKQIENLVEKGYARMLTPEEIAAPNRRTWYLPTFITKNPNKPEKVRLVWDAAAQSGGKALNDYIWSGPDLLNSLFDLLLSFRVGRVAICGDIAEMFHQIRVKPADTHAQRFLWSDSKSERQEPNVYVMEALTFGINCAPCIAHFIRDKNADRFCQQYPQAAQAVKDYHYVDDFIYSGDDYVEVGNIATQVRDIHAAGGFHIRNWSSNSKEVLRILKSDSLLPEAVEITATEKVLGLYWVPNSDVFTFICKFARLKRNVLDSDKTPTKRELLQVLMSMYDPLGFISCFTIELKILLQEVWRSGIGWDTGLPDALLPKWIRWKRILTTIAGLTIPRCYFDSSDQVHDVQLHTFVDASELAYAAVCYLRIRQGKRTYLSFVASKAKVAPLSPLSIPRMELQAAVIGAKLSNRIQRNPSLSINSSCYWSDSKTVLKWLRMDPRKFQQFVMHRVGEILEFTNVSQWNWVPTNLNPADLATKTHNANKHETWLHGPDYLLQDQHEWPKCDDLGPPNNAEVRHNILFIDNAPMELKLNAEYFSDWRRLYRALARFILYIEKLKAKQAKASPPTEVSYEMIQQARTLLLRHAQSSEFNPEIRNLTRDENQLLRTRGRAENLNGQNQILLPYGHHITRLIVNWYHQEMHHTSHETCINRIRGMFYIPRLRVLYKGMRKSCQRCKNESAMPDPPQMAPLPIARLAAYQRPFTYVGIDYFGPFLVAIICDKAQTINFNAVQPAFDDIKWKFNPPAAPHMGEHGSDLFVPSRLYSTQSAQRENSPVKAYKVHYGKWNLS
ncbi:uncharacterized protein [Drosophila tropicalis]|uniref:uncharacterized protein n=1 Tax=Drosophila tropicalis TaxID=46794 RepID=UPI0035ABF66E